LIISDVKNSSAAEKIVSTIKSGGKGDAIAIKADVSTVEGGKQLLDESMKAFGKIDALILNAAVLSMKSLADIDESQYDTHFSANVKGPLFTVKHAVDKGMFPPTGGRILFFSSTLTANTSIAPY
ncbi:NAD(P)-binding protein, partial [Dendrothele bispora CBS 962.96]